MAQVNPQRIGWMIACLLSLVGCSETPAPPPDVIPPQVFAQPAGGVFPTLSPPIVLHSTKGATIYYTLDGSRPTVTSPAYRIPLMLDAPDVTLRFFARDAAGNHSQERIERYRHVYRAPQITLRTAPPLILGPQQSTSVHWVCAQQCGRFRLIVGDGGWDSSMLLATGIVQDGEEMHTRIDAARLPMAETRLWIYVQSDQGVLGAASLPLVSDRQPPQPRAWPAGGTYGTLPSVALLADEAATVHYTTDGSPPSRASAIYQTPLRLNGNTTLRFLAVDRVGNQSSIQTEVYHLHEQAPSVRLQQFPGFRLDVRQTLHVTWRSSRRGQYLLSANGQPLQRGRVERATRMQSKVHGWSLNAPHNRLQLRVTDDEGREGSTSFLLDTFFRETFADTTALDAEATTAAHDTTTHRLTLPIGPIHTGTYETHHTSRGIASQGSYAYVANTRGGLQVLDLALPKEPRLVGNLFMYGEPKALATYKHYVYLAADTSGVQVFDVSRPQVPLLVGHQRLPGHASAIAIVDRHAYVGTQQHGLYIYALTDPRRPNLLAHLPLEMPIMHLAATATHVYVAGFAAGVAIIDVSTPTMPVLLNIIPTAAEAGAALGVAVHEQRLCIAANALLVYDVQNAVRPHRLARLPLSSAHGLAMRQGLIYIADQYQGLRIVDVSTPQPQILSTYDTPDRAVRLALQGHIAFVADVLGGLHLIDISRPEKPTLLQTLPKLGQIVDVRVEEGFAYLANRKGQARLLVADVRHPGQARIVGSYSNGSTTDVVVSGPRAYVLDAFGGLQVLDVSQPQRPVLLGAQTTAGVAQGLTLYGTYALVAAGKAGLHLIDVSEPAHPTHVASLALPGESVDVVTWGRFAYVAAGTAGIVVVDLAQPETPRLLGSVQPPPNGENGKIVRLAAGNSHLYASDTTPHLLVFSLVSPQQPRLLQQLPSPQGTLWALALHGRLLYAATILKHLIIYDVGDPAQTRQLGTAASGARDLAVVPPDVLLATESYKRRGGGLRLFDTYASLPPHFSVPWPTEALDVAATGSHVYVAAGTAGLIVGHYSSTGEFQHSAPMQWQDTAQRLVLCGPHAYVGGRQALAVVDITTPTNPKLLSTLELGIPIVDLACTGHLLILAARTRGLLLVDASNPAQLTLQATVAVPGDLQHLAWWGGGYLLGAGDGLTLFDLTTPSQPRIGWHLDLTDPVQDLAVHGNHAYIAAGDAGLHVIPLRTTAPQKPQAIWAGEVLALAVWGRQAYVIDQHRGLVYLDLSDPTRPSQLDATPLPFPPTMGLRLFAHDTAIYLASRETGLQQATTAVSRTSVRVPQAVVHSLKVDAATHPVASVTLRAQAWPGAYGRITYEVSNNGGNTWAQILPGVPYPFAARGSDLRWRARLSGTTPLADPALYEVELTYELAPLAP